jgi:hypothetical protein
MSDSTNENKPNPETMSDLHINEFAALTAQVTGNRNQLKQNLTHLQASLDHLRLVIKYQAFDLEATRRENTDLRTLLEMDGPKQ